MKTKGMMGIGALIIFIAMILVAAIAATVLLTTSSVLESKALMVGNEARERIVTNVEIVSVVAEDGRTGNSLNNFSVSVRLAGGAPEIFLNNTVLTLSSPSFSQTYSYSESKSTTTYNKTAEYEVTINDYLEAGELLTFNFNSPQAIGENQEIRITIQPQNGGRILKILRTPNVVINQREDLYP